MEREYCPWCYQPFAFDPRRVEQWPHQLICASCQGGIIIVSRPKYLVGRGNRVPPETMNTVPRI